MSTATVLSAFLVGTEAFVVTVRAEVESGLPRFEIDGLKEAQLRETLVRVYAAIVNAGFAFPVGRVTVHLGLLAPRR